MSERLAADLASLRIQRDEPPPPRSWGSVLAWVAGVAAVLALGVYGASVLGPRLFQTEVELTEIRTLSPAQAAILLTSSGYVMPQRESKVSAKLVGRVQTVLVKQGDLVDAGQTLVTLDPTEQRSAMASSRARVSAAQARALVSQASVAEASRQLAREKQLATAGASGRSVSEDLESRVRVLEAQAAAAQADVDSAKADLQQLEQNLKYLTVGAPIGGVITSKPVTVGELVGPQMPSLVAEIADFASLMVETDVPETKLAQLQVGTPAEVVLDAYPLKRLRGEVAEVSPRINRTKATALVRVRFLDPVTEALPDMAARVSFLSRPQDAQAMKEPPKLFVPRSAVAERNGQKVVFRVEQGRVRQERVQLGDPLGAGFELKQGPLEGTKVIANPPVSLEEGSPVKEKTRT